MKMVPSNGGREQLWGISWATDWLAVDEWVIRAAMEKARVREIKVDRNAGMTKLFVWINRLGLSQTSAHPHEW